MRDICIYIQATSTNLENASIAFYDYMIRVVIRLTIRKHATTNFNTASPGIHGVRDKSTLSN